MTNSQVGAPLTLGGFLRDRRARLPPGPDVRTRRRTPGLRREEVAARAGVSVVWYTWLEQGRGGPPSVEVLERLARALELDDTGREVLFLLAQQRPPPVRMTPASPVTPALRRVLEALRASPALVKTTTWDIVAWNTAALAVLANYEEAPPEDLNLLRRLFGPKVDRGALPDWERDARAAVALFRVDVARAGDAAEAVALAAELQATSPDFRRIWAENEMRGEWIGTKRLRHPIAGPLTLECSAFSVAGADGLTMVVFTPVTTADEMAIERLLATGAQKVGSAAGLG